MDQEKLLWAGLYVHDPYFGPNRAMKTDDFMNIWQMDRDLNNDRWTLAVFPSDADMPFSELRNSSLTHVNLATSYYRSGRLKESYSQWLLAEEGLPDNPYPLYSLGMLCIRMDQYSKAAAFAVFKIQPG
jgi:hypothetical protein